MRSSSSFSIAELLVALAIFSLVLGFGVPSYGQGIAALELANHAERLAATLMQARTEAVKRQVRVNVCKSNDGRQCSATGTWSAGWIMFAEDNRDGDIEPPESVIRHEPAPGNGITVSASRPLDAYVAYTNFGYARMLNGALQMGTFVVCKPGQKASHVVLVESTTGAVTIGVASLLPRLSVRGAPLATPWLRFQSPLIEPDRRITRIRLSDKDIMLSPTEGRVCQ